MEYVMYVFMILVYAIIVAAAMMLPPSGKK